MRGFAEIAKFASLIRAAKFKGAVRGSENFSAQNKARFRTPFVSRAVKFKKARVAAAVIEFLRFANRAAKIKVATWAFTSGAKSMFASRTVKFQAIALCLKSGARRKGAAFKQNTPKAAKFTSAAGE